MTWCQQTHLPRLQQARRPVSQSTTQVPMDAPLSGDYAFQLSNVAPLYAGDPGRQRLARDRPRPRATRQHGEIAPRSRRKPDGGPGRIEAAAALSWSTRPPSLRASRPEFGGPLFTVLSDHVHPARATRARELRHASRPRVLGRC